MNPALREYGQIVRHRWRWVAWGVIAAIAATAALLILWPPLYRSDAKVFVRTPGDVSQVQDGGTVYAQSRAVTYAALAQSTGLSTRVVADLGLNLSPDKLANRVRARQIPGTSLFDVKVSAPSAAEARRTAEVLLNELTAQVRDLEAVPGSILPRADLVVVDPPTDGARIVAWGAPLYRFLIGAVVIGAMFGGFAAVIRAMLAGPGGQPKHALAAPADPQKDGPQKDMEN